MRNWLRQKLPSPERLDAHRSLRWMGPLLRRPWLWQFNRRRVALGAAIGVFFGLMVPVAQIALAALLAVLLRANLPVAVVSTLVSNPLTYAPIGVMAYRTGSDILGRAVKPADLEALREEGDPPHGEEGPGWVEQVRAIGKPLLVGLAVFATIGAMATWAFVHVAWTVGVQRRRRRRRRRAQARGGG